MGYTFNGYNTDNAFGYVWDSTVLAWIKAVQAGGGSTVAASTQVSVSTGSVRVVQSSATELLAKVYGGTTSAISSVTASSTPGLLLAAGTRFGATIYNDSTGLLYVALGSTVSTANYTLQMAAASYFETPFMFSGAIHGVWSTNNGQARITSVT